MIGRTVMKLAWAKFYKTPSQSTAGYGGTCRKDRKITVQAV
jgi:hypothetical protein